MARKVILVGDPGIDGAFAIALALHDPVLDVLGIAATAGNVDAEQATRNVQTVVEQIDPPRWPRLGAAPEAGYEVHAKHLHGPKGLGAASFPCAQLHHMHPSDKLIQDLVRQNPKDVTIVTMGPLTVLARAFDRDPELPSLVHRLVCVGGTWHEPGNATAVAEFHFYCDPPAARQVLRSGVPLTLLPLDVTRKLVFSPADLQELSERPSRTNQFLRQIVPFGIGTTSNLYGVEGFHLKDVLAIIALALPESVSTRPIPVDVETRGELTRGMSVFDARPSPASPPNVDLAISVNAPMARAYLENFLRKAA